MSDTNGKGREQDTKRMTNNLFTETHSFAFNDHAKLLKFITVIRM